MRFLVLWLCVAACSSDDTNAAGEYAVTVTDRDNGCTLGNWTPGMTAAATVTLTQHNNDVTAVVTGIAGIALDLALGDHSYTGKINGSDLDLNLFGTRTSTSGNCTYTVNSEIHGVLSGDALTGQIDYTTATNGNPDCATLERCRSFQDLTGTRMP